MKKVFRLALFFLALMLILSACSAKISSSLIKSYPPLDYDLEVMVLGLNDEVPFEAEHIGTIRIGDSGFSTNCRYDVVIDLAKLEARKVGGDAIKIVKHNQPDVWSSCHRITAEILKLNDQ